MQDRISGGEEELSRDGNKTKGLTCETEQERGHVIVCPDERNCIYEKRGDGRYVVTDIHGLAFHSKANVEN